MNRAAYALALFDICAVAGLVTWAVLTSQEPPATAAIGYIFLGLFAMANLVFAIPALALARRGTQPALALALAILPIAGSVALYFYMVAG
jgi:hypothetical protein